VGRDAKSATAKATVTRPLEAIFTFAPPHRWAEIQSPPGTVESSTIVPKGVEWQVREVSVSPMPDIQNITTGNDLGGRAYEI
jgi:hypothetical protein